MKIILASASPRRKELLKKLIDTFDIESSSVEELFPSSLNLFKVSLYISNLKAFDIHYRHPNDIVIGCDTTIVYKNKIIGKADNKDEAKKNLMSFSNNVHYVVTGLTLYYGNERYQLNSINKVYFNKLTEAEIDEYLENDEYVDKAGSYAIQGIAKKFIKKYKGDFDAIVGLPTKKLTKLFYKLKILTK